MEQNTELNPGTGAAPEEHSNIMICPNCMEPNPDDLAVCQYCGMPLHPGTEADPSNMPESEAELAANRSEAAPEGNKTGNKKQQGGFQRVMPWLGLYLIYYAITGCFDVKRQVAQALEAGQPINEKLAYFSQGIWFIAGLLMAWPLVKKGWRKLRHLPEEDEETAAENTEVSEVTGDGGEDTEPEEAETTAGLPDAEAEPDNEMLSEENTGPEETEESEAPAEDTSDTEFEEDDEAAKWL